MIIAFTSLKSICKVRINSVTAFIPFVRTFYHSFLLVQLEYSPFTLYFIFRFSNTHTHSFTSFQPICLLWFTKINLHRILCSDSILYIWTFRICLSLYLLVWRLVKAMLLLLTSLSFDCKCKIDAFCNSMQFFQKEN